MSRDIPYSALQFMTFEMLKRQHLDAQMPGRRKKRVKGIADDLWMGAVCLFLSLSLSVVALLTKLYSGCMAARLHEVSLGQDVSLR